MVFDDLVKDNIILNEVNITVNFIKDLVKKGEKSFAPLVRIKAVDKDFKITDIIVSLTDIPEDSNERHYMMNQLGRQCISQGYIPILITFHCESWMLVVDEDTRLGLPIRDHSERIEVIQVTTLAINRKACGRIFEMRRKEDDSLILFPYKEEEYMKVSSIDDEDDCIIVPYLLTNFFAGAHEEYFKRFT